jgi:hypothetical protein
MKNSTFIWEERPIYTYSNIPKKFRDFIINELPTSSQQRNGWIGYNICLDKFMSVIKGKAEPIYGGDKLSISDSGELSHTRVITQQSPKKAVITKIEE